MILFQSQYRARPYAQVRPHTETIKQNFVPHTCHSVFAGRRRAPLDTRQGQLFVMFAEADRAEGGNVTQNTPSANGLDAAAPLHGAPEGDLGHFPAARPARGDSAPQKRPGRPSGPRDDIAAAGLAVRHRRRALGYTRQSLSKLAGVDPKTLRSLERGERWPWDESRKKIEAALQWEPGFLDVLREREGALAGAGFPNEVFRVVPTPDGKYAIIALGDDTSREVARFYDRAEAVEYARWRNPVVDSPANS